jgi:hypothetical protein
LQHSGVFKRVGDYVASDILNSYKPQEFSSIVWAFSTAGVQHPDLFDKVGHHTVAMDNLKSFTPQNLENTVWAYATANELRPALFEKIAIDVANRQKFLSFNGQDLANIAWAYTVANADAPMLFNDFFTKTVLERCHGFLDDHLTQLYQWHLWQTKELSHAGLPDNLRDRCLKAFTESNTTTSCLHMDVVSELKSMNLNSVEEHPTPSGYSIDALVKVDGRIIGIEVDGPTHFINRNPIATTMLKHRQITSIDKIPLVSVPYWEWDKLGTDHDKKQQYLQVLLGMSDQSKK